MRLLVWVFVLVLALSTNAAEQRTTLDQAAEDYVHLALEIGAHEKDFVDAYFGPPEWRVEAEAHPRNISELKAEADRIQSLIFYGPPGTGKTSLAQIIARQTKSKFERLSGVESNVADMRRVLELTGGNKLRAAPRKR